jgi:hypothetical protein
MKMTDKLQEALDDMHSYAIELIRLISIESSTPSGGTSWGAVELVLHGIRSAWEDAKACEVMASTSPTAEKIVRDVVDAAYEKSKRSYSKNIGPDGWPIDPDQKPSGGGEK